MIDLESCTRVRPKVSVTLAPIGSTPASILTNVQLGGAIMWIGGDALMLLACIPIAVAWVRWEARRTVELDARLDAQGR